MQRRLTTMAAAVVLVLAGACSTSTSTGDTSGTTTSGSAPSTTGRPAATGTPPSTEAPSGTVPATTATVPDGAAAAKAVFLEKGNAICKTMNEQSAALSKQYEASAKGPALTQQLLDQNATLIDDSVDQIQALPQPPGDEARLAAMYADVRRLAEYSRQLAGAAGRADRAAMERLQGEGNALQRSTNAEFTAYGLTECGKGS